MLQIVKHVYNVNRKICQIKNLIPENSIRTNKNLRSFQIFSINVERFMYTLKGKNKASPIKWYLNS